MKLGLVKTFDLLPVPEKIENTGYLKEFKEGISSYRE